MIIILGVPIIWIFMVCGLGESELWELFMARKSFVMTTNVVTEVMDDLWFDVLFNCISVITGQLAGDFERLCAMEPVND